MVELLRAFPSIFMLAIRVAAASHKQLFTSENILFTCPDLGFVVNICICAALLIQIVHQFSIRLFHKNIHIFSLHFFCQSVYKEL